uniref:Uncharacterized protein n=1 Tax=Arundo donax TaxID=35708 RepID=A0A0A8ZK18_ARUDO
MSVRHTRYGDVFKPSPRSPCDLLMLDLSMGWA